MVALEHDHLGFEVRSESILDRILIPKFYDPELGLQGPGDRFRVVNLEDLLLPSAVGSHLGTWIPREFHGSGEVPYVRTSDLAHWRIRPDFKKGVSHEVYSRFKHRYDVQADDILFVAHGSYKIGDVALITTSDLPLLLQDHVFRLRAAPEKIDPYLLLAALSTTFVRRQVRSRQFSAEIIDKIGERHLGIRVAIPRSDADCQALADRVRSVIAEQSAVRLELAEIEAGMGVSYGPRASTRLGFELDTSEVKNRILVPRYYDPDLETSLREAEAEGPWITLDELMADGVIEVSAGVEPGKLAYGTGEIPFVRTSDFAEGEILRDPKHGVSDEIYNQYKRNGGLEPDDVLVVRDGTYLVGSSALVGSGDLPALHCGGIVRLRVKKREVLEPQTLLGLLNVALVRRQFRSKQFSRDVIETLGNRLLEVRIPWHSSKLFALCTARMTALMARKAHVKSEISLIIGDLEPQPPKSTLGRPGWSMR